MKTLNLTLKHQILIGIALSLWSFLFAFFSRPFEHGNMDFQKWIYVSIGYSIIAFIAYFLVSLWQNYIYEKLSKWNNFLEISVYILFYILYTIMTYLYYKSSVIEGNYELSQYLINIIFNIILIFTPLIFFVRRYAFKLIHSKEDFITIKGENKLDILKIKQSDLICISNSQNYVEIFFLENNELNSKLLRSSLKKIQSDFKFLIQIHRSHLINPSHFKMWKDSTTISLTQIELPVSKNYKNQLLSL
jgi:hypothetical protein